MRPARFLLIPLLGVGLAACTEMLKAPADNQSSLPVTGVFQAIPGLPTGDAVLVRSFDSGVASDITLDSTDPITGTKSFAIPEVVRFQVFNTPPSGGQVWLPNRQQTAKFRSRPFAKERINAATSAFNFKYRSRDVGVLATTDVPLAGPVTASVGDVGIFLMTLRIKTEGGDNFPNPNAESGPRDWLTASFYDEGGDCARMSFRLLRGFIAADEWVGDEREIFVSFPIGEVLRFSATSLGNIVTAQVSGEGVVDLGTSANGWEMACTNVPEGSSTASIGGRLLDGDGEDLFLADYLFPDSLELAVISVEVDQGVTISSYTNPAGGTVTNDDFEVSGPRPFSSLDDIEVRVREP